MTSSPDLILITLNQSTTCNLSMKCSDLSQTTDFARACTVLKHPSLLNSVRTKHVIHLWHRSMNNLCTSSRLSISFKCVFCQSPDLQAVRGSDTVHLTAQSFIYSLSLSLKITHDRNKSKKPMKSITFTVVSATKFVIYHSAAA